MNDREIVDMFLERDERALKAVSDKYMSYCAKIAENIVGSHDEAQECVNEALMRAWESIPPHEPEMISTYLGKLTRNIALNRRRQSLTQKRGSGVAEAVFEELSEVIPSGDVEGEFAAKELAAEINAFLRGLPAEQRGMFVCRYWYCDNIPAIAAEFTVSKNKVYVTLNRVRKKLREYLRKRGYEL